MNRMQVSVLANQYSQFRHHFIFAEKSLASLALTLFYSCLTIGNTGAERRRKWE